MIRYKCVVAYDGNAYCGWQSQRNGNSIQEQIEAALSRIMDTPIVITGSGRTDAKVNAMGQVFHFDAPKEIPIYKLKHAVNNFLPGDIYIRSMEVVSNMFHSRFCARSKRYDYRINLGEYDVFNRNHTYYCPYKLDIERMKKGAEYLVGTHDFTSLNANSFEETPDQVRTIYSIDFLMENNILTISYFGRGFLRYMVRMMTAILIEVGQSRLNPEDIQRILEAKSKTASRKNAPPEGLTLMEVNHFEIVAEDDSYLVREFLPEDDLPEGMCLNYLEDAVKNRSLPRYYLLADRHSQKQYAIYKLDKECSSLMITKTFESQMIVEQLKNYQKLCDCSEILEINK